VLVKQVKSCSGLNPPRMFDGLATSDDLGFLVLVVEQFYRKWQRKAFLEIVEEKTKSNDYASNKKQKTTTKRNEWNEWLTYKEGNGLSGKKPQERLASLRKYIGGVVKQDSTRRERAEAYFQEAWDEWTNLLGKNEASDESSNQDKGLPELPEEDVMDELDLEEFGIVVVI